MASASSVQKTKNLKPGFCQNHTLRADCTGCGDARIAIDSCSSAQLSTGGPCKVFWGLLHRLLPIACLHGPMPFPDGSRWPLVKLASWSTHQGVWRPKDGNTQWQRPSAIYQGSIQSVLTHLGHSLSKASASFVKNPKNLKPGFCQNRTPL